MKAITEKDTECIVTSFSQNRKGTIMEGYAITDKEVEEITIKNLQKKDNGVHIYRAIIPRGTECEYDNYTAYSKGIIVGEEIL